ncbi:hypothetical protein [Calothrix rhizosoleniae]|uniref:hypothetical protein n=1 Tax=Calothrix rhizosoleniae TaxID=888997 RepID=UPI000B49D135|nr:hypothetical protein [Calothrix rhizosoleniae]
MAQYNLEAHKAIETSMTEPLIVWPSVIAPATPVKNPDDVSKLVKNIEENSQKVIKDASTKAQR